MKLNNVLFFDPKVFNIKLQVLLYLRHASRQSYKSARYDNLLQHKHSTDLKIAYQ